MEEIKNEGKDLFDVIIMSPLWGSWNILFIIINISPFCILRQSYAPLVLQIRLFGVEIVIENNPITQRDISELHFTSPLYLFYSFSLFLTLSLSLLLPLFHSILLFHSLYPSLSLFLTLPFLSHYLTLSFFLFSLSVHIVSFLF